MAAKKDMEHFLRFSTIAVVVIAALAILGLASLVLNGPGDLSLGSRQAGAENLLGGASDTGYYAGTLVLKGQTWQLRLDLVDRVLNLQGQKGEFVQIGLRQADTAALTGSWVRDGMITPLTVDLTDLIVTFHFPDGPVAAALRPIGRRNLAGEAFLWSE